MASEPLSLTQRRGLYTSMMFAIYYPYIIKGEGVYYVVQLVISSVINFLRKTSNIYALCWNPFDYIQKITCSHIFWSYITHCSINFCRHVGTFLFWSFFCQPKPGELCIVILSISNRKLVRKNINLTGKLIQSKF